MFKKSKLALLIILLMSSIAYAANLTTRIEDTAPTADDLMYCVDDPGGTPADRKCTVGNVAKGMTSTNLTDTADILYETELDAEAELETQLTDTTNVIVSTEIDTLAEVNTIITDATLFTGAHTTDTNLTQEEVEDFAGSLVTDGTGTHTRVTITYQDATGDVDFVVDDMNDDIPEAGDYTNLTGGTNLTHSPTGTLNVDDAFLLNNGDTGTGAYDFSAADVELPNTTACVATDCDAANEAGRICIDTDATSGQQVFVCEGLSGWVLQGDGTGAADTVDTQVDGVSQSTGTDIYDFDGADFTLTESPADDFDVTVNDSGIDHDATTNFLAAEHVDWAGASAGTIHATNYVDNDTQLSGEQVDDFVNLLLKDVDSVNTRITLTYDDVNDAFDFVVDDMNDDVPEAADYLNLTGGDGIDHGTTGTVKIDQVTAGSDADSSTLQSDSGLEIVGSKITLLRGCADNEILKWDETQDDWNCEADSGAAGGDSISIDSSAVVDPDFVSTGDIDFVDTLNTVTANINSDVIVNADVNSAAAISISKTALTAGTNITLSTDTLNVDDAFVINSGADTMAGALTINPGTLFIQEQADASADVAGQGQLWVNTATPNELWFTDDAGTDFQLGTGGGSSSLTNSVNQLIQHAKLTGSYVTTAHTGVSAAVGASIDAANGEWRLLFDDTIEEAGVWGFRLPPDYSSAPVVKVIYTMVSATSGTVEAELSVMAVTDGESTAASFDTTNVASATVPGTAGLTDELSITLTNNDSMAAGDFVYFYLSFDSDDGTNDTATGDREVVMLQFQYTSSGGSAASALTDLTDVGVTTATSGNLLVADGASWESVAVSSDVTLASTGAMTIQANSVALATDTTGDFVNSITAGTNITSTGATSGENITHSLSVDDAFLVNDANDTTTGDITENKADPSFIFDVATAIDTDWWLGVQDDAGSDDDDPFSIGTGTTPGTGELFTMSSAGKVGIGTTDPSAFLTVVSDNAFNTVRFSAFAENAQGVGINFIKGRGTPSSTSASISGDTIGILRAQGWDGTTAKTITNVQSIAQTVSGSTMSGKVIIRTNDTSGVMQDRFVIDENGSVMVSMSSSGTSLTAGPFQVFPPTTQTIAATNTITADGCGTLKKIDAASSVTTSTTDTFTTPAAANEGCCMDVINVDTVDTITLDNNANFFSAGAADVALGPGDTVRVCSSGLSGAWYQVGATGNN